MSPLFLLIFAFISFIICSSEAHSLKKCGFDQIYQFGDSLSDTGNTINVFPRIGAGRFPFGMTINKPTGRSSDGLLMIDFIAKSASLPFLDAYLSLNETSKGVNGVNFAFFGATALFAEDLEKLGLATFMTRSLNVQLGWLDTFLKTNLCNASQDCCEKLKSALFIMGEIGYNDYNVAFFGGKTIEEVQNTMVPRVVQVIKDVIKKVIGYGAVQVVVPGLPKLGCSPAYLAAFSTNSSASFDEHQCLDNFNAFFSYHNELLQTALDELKMENPNVRIIYGDLEKGFQWILDNLPKLGIKSVNVACCGSGGIYNVSPGTQGACGVVDEPFCPNPKQYMFWDGLHLSHKTNNYLAKQLIHDVLPQLLCNA